jgi:hypothetical protein
MVARSRLAGHGRVRSCPIDENDGDRRGRLTSGDASDPDTREPIDALSARASKWRPGGKTLIEHQECSGRTRVILVAETLGF